MKIAALRSVLVCLTIAAQGRLMAQGAPLDLTTIRLDSITEKLSSRFGSGLAPGDGINFSQRYWPIVAIRPPFGGARPAPLPQPQIILGSQVLPPHGTSSNQDYTIVTDYEDNLTIDQEAQVLTANFSATYLLDSLDAAYAKVTSSRTTGRAIYFMYEIEGEKLKLDPKNVAWPAGVLAQAESISDQNERIRYFVMNFGSHFATEITAGARIAIRVNMNTLDASQQTSLSGSISAAFGLFSASGSLGDTLTNLTQTNQISINAEVTCGGVDPSPQALVLTSLPDVVQFLADFHADKIKLRSGPVSCTATSYWATLDPVHDKVLFDDLAHTVTNPAPSPFGVPPGTIIAWHPRPGDFVRSPQGTIVNVVTPDGWVLCDGNNGTPNLQTRFIMGADLTHLDQVGVPGGSPTHHHTGITERMGVNGGVNDAHNGANDSAGPPATTGTTHSHAFTTSEASNIPPNIPLVFIMRT